MRVMSVGIKFDETKISQVVSINFANGSEILSVQVQNNEPILWVCFMSPSESFSQHFKKKAEEFQLTIGKCGYADIEIDSLKYLSNVNIGDDTFAVFYKKVETL